MPWDGLGLNSGIASRCPSKESEDPRRRDGSHAVYTPINFHLCPFHFGDSQGWRKP